MPERIDRFVGQYRFLSNFWLCSIEYHDVLYPSVEHAYQAAKSTDPTEREIIRDAYRPGVAKQLGRSALYVRPDWDSVKLDVMELLLRKKFSRYLNPVLAQKLLDTGDAELVEDNNWGDTFWGVCRGEGENHLGRLLMEIREGLRRA